MPVYPFMKKEKGVAKKVLQKRCLEKGVSKKGKKEKCHYRLRQPLQNLFLRIGLSEGYQGISKHMLGIPHYRILNHGSLTFRMNETNKFRPQKFLQNLTNLVC